jgi:hypothetical protein
MLKSHSGAVSSAISYVDIYVYPSYDTDVVAAAYLTDVKSRFGATANPINLAINVAIGQYSSVDCDAGSYLTLLNTDEFNLLSGSAVFQTSTSAPVTPNPSVASLKITSLNINGNDISSNPFEFITGSYVYRIFGYGQCQGL